MVIQDAASSLRRAGALYPQAWWKSTRASHSSTKFLLYCIPLTKTMITSALLPVPVWCKEFLPSSVPKPMYCHNCGAVTGASYAGTATERKRCVITCKKESALSNLWALVCICMFFRLWIGMISFTWALVTRAGLWAYCLIRCLNAVTAGLFITFLVVYFFFSWPRKYLLIFYKSELLSLEKKLIRYFGSCQDVANGNQGQNSIMVLDLIR